MSNATPDMSEVAELVNSSIKETGTHICTPNWPVKVHINEECVTVGDLMLDGSYIIGIEVVPAVDDEAAYIRVNFPIDELTIDSDTSDGQVFAATKLESDGFWIGKYEVIHTCAPSH